MYVMKKDGQHYVYVRDGKTYVNSLFIKGASALTIYMPDGSLLTDAYVTVNGVAYTTDSEGKVYLTGEYGKSAAYSIVNADGYTAEVRVTYGTDTAVTLKLFVLTVDAESGAYYKYYTITTTIGSDSYTGSITKEVTPGTSITIKAVGGSSSDYSYYNSYVVVDGTSTGKTSYTFTMDADHDITFTDGTYYYIGSGT